MTTKEAKSYGGAQITKAAILLFALIEMIILINETQGDFANGILFFIAGQANIYILVFIAVSFLTLYLLGRQAAYGIVEKNKNYMLTGLLFGLISTVLIIAYVAIAILLLNESRQPGYNLTYQKEIKGMILRWLLLAFPPTVLIWLYATRRIKIKSSK